MVTQGKLDGQGIAVTGPNLTTSVYCQLDDLLLYYRNLGPKCNVAVENCVSYCAKAIGEETYFVGDKQELVRFIFVQQFAMNDQKLSCSKT